MKRYNVGVTEMKKIVVIAIVLIVLLAVPPCSGYILKVASWDKSGNTVQLYYSDSEAGSLAMSGASKAAD